MLLSDQPAVWRRCFPVALAVALLSTLLSPAITAANAPPDPPVILGPASTGASSEDVHMEIGAPFHDPDGDSHAATDWEIRTEDGATVVWAAYASKELVHAHFSDGAFQGPLANKRRLNFAAPYRFRVRFQDSRGAWSEWSERLFSTAAYLELPLRPVQAVLWQPAPTWQTDGGTPIGLPPGARTTLETVAGTAVLTLVGSGGGVEAIIGARLAQPEVVRLRVAAPADAWLRLPASRLRFVSDQPARLTAFLPALSLAPGQEQILWIADSGATIYGTADQPHLHREHVARTPPLPWELPPGYQLQAVSAGFQLPTSLAFVPNPGRDPAAPRFYVTELYGRIKVVTNDGRTFNFAENLLNFSPSGAFPGTGETGVIGVCLSPDSRDVYATMIYQAADGLRNKMVRIRSTDGLTATAVDDLLVARPGQGLSRPSHQIQQCSVGPDGKLYVSVGEGPASPAAQDDRSFNGKVLRLNPDGSAPTDNPFYDPANPTAPISYQYTKGHRNAFGMAWRPSTGQLFLSENGSNVDRLVHIVPGRNYGWDGTDKSMRTHAMYLWPEAHWSPVGMDFAEGPAAGGLAPAEQGRLFVASAGPVYARGPQATGKAIQAFEVTAEGTVAGPPTVFARYVGEGRGSIADLKLQPDGLYFTELYLDEGDGGPAAPGGKVWRIRYTGQAGFTPSVSSGAAPLTVAFADTSTLRGTAAWSWDFGDGTSSGEVSPSHTFSQPGRYAVSLTVTAADGTTSEHLALITVTNEAGQVPDPAGAVRLAAPPTPASVFFPETGMGVGGGFKHYWEANGGLAQFGYPLTNELREVNPADGREYTVQYFERARFEYHPEHAGTAYETQLGLLGRQVTAPRSGEPPFQPVADPGDGSWFPETGHTLRDTFRDHWQAGGGAAIYGLPLSEPFMEESPADGANYLVQYFERARLELHPEAAGRADAIRLARLGTAVFVQQPPGRIGLQTGARELHAHTPDAR